jgi:hypothetical protein
MFSNGSWSLNEADSVDALGWTVCKFSHCGSSNEGYSLDTLGLTESKFSHDGLS